MRAQPSTIRMTNRHDVPPVRRLTKVEWAGHTDGDLLDAAAVLMEAGESAAVTMAAVAKRAGATSDALYHRFPSRGALLGALWLRTTARVQAGVVGAFESPVPADGCRAAAVHTLRWCRSHPAEAQLLLRGPDDFAQSDWPGARGRPLDPRCIVTPSSFRPARCCAGRRFGRSCVPCTPRSRSRQPAPMPGRWRSADSRRRRSTIAKPAG